MTVCDRGEGGGGNHKKSVTYFMDGPKHVYIDLLHNCNSIAGNCKPTT